MGSSASSSFGRPTMARAIATRCCCPPESCDGKWSTREVRPDAVERGESQPAPLAGRGAAVEQRELDVVEHRQVGDQVEGLEDEAESRVAQPRALRVAERGISRPASATVPREWARRAGR